MAVATKRGLWAQRLTWIALVLSVGAVLAALIAAVGSGQGAWHFGDGFLVLRYAFYASIGAVLLCVAAFLLAHRIGRTRRLIAFLTAAAFILYLGLQIRTARTVPAIHDIATDLDDMPQYRALKVREDNLEDIPDMDRPELKAMAPEERWKAIHREAYADIEPMLVPWTVAETIAKAQAVADDKGWDIAHVDPARGTLEATDTTRFFRFKDDVVVRARAAPEGKGTIVDMRSISRVGGSDVGVNAARIRDFFKDLRQS